MPSQIILAGARELDPDEQDYIAAESVTLVLSEDRGQNTWLSALDAGVALGITNAYIRIDFDVIDPEEFPWVGWPTPRGISVEILRQAVAQIYDHFDVLGISAVEINADGQNAIRAANIVKELIA